jgi:hypothetical protein
MDGLQYHYDLSPAMEGFEEVYVDPAHLLEDLKLIKLQRRRDLIRMLSIGLLTLLIYIESLARVIPPGPLYLILTTLLGVFAIVATTNRLDRIDQPSDKKSEDDGAKMSFTKILKTIWPAALVMIAFGILGYRSTAVPAAFPLVLTVINLFFVIADNDRVRRLECRLNDAQRPT